MIGYKYVILMFDLLALIDQLAVKYIWLID